MQGSEVAALGLLRDVAHAGDAMDGQHAAHPVCYVWFMKVLLRRVRSVIIGSVFPSIDMGSPRLVRAL